MKRTLLILLLALLNLSVTYAQHMSLVKEDSRIDTFTVVVDMDAPMEASVPDWQMTVSYNASLLRPIGVMNRNCAGCSLVANLDTPGIINASGFTTDNWYRGALYHITFVSIAEGVASVGIDNVVISEGAIESTWVDTNLIVDLNTEDMKTFIKDFDVQIDGNNINITWETEDETPDDFAGFYLIRDGATIGFVFPKGTSSTYSFDDVIINDLAPESDDDIFYELVKANIGGGTVIVGDKTIEFEDQIEDDVEITIFPNPLTPGVALLTIKSSQAGMLHVDIRNKDGVALKSFVLNAQKDGALTHILEYDYDGPVMYSTNFKPFTE